VSINLLTSTEARAAMNADDRPRLFKLLFAPPKDSDSDAANSAWPVDNLDDDDRPEPEEIDDDFALELDDEYWEALIPDDDYESAPDEGDFWTDFEAA
jgi:hypothetical protein